MALAERATLIAELRLDDKMSRGLKSATVSLGKLGKGVGTAAKSLAKLGGAAVGAGIAGIGVAVHSGLANLMELESAVTSVDGAIKRMGLTGQVTGAQVATWANEIEANVGAAFDDKAIVAATSTLIRFGKVTPKNLKPAMQIITDLAVKTGSVDSAATLLAKALADPEKAAGKLARSGVILTKQQQEQIKAFMKAGKVGKAQEVILKSLTKTTKGAAAASQGPYKKAMSILADVTEDAQKALAEGLLPVIEKVAGKLSTFLADKGNVQKIRDFGKGLADGFEKVLGFVEKIPWASIGESLQIAGQGAKTLIKAFTNLPPEAQATILGLIGLNKLSGGAIGGLVGELGKGLVKGVLGLNAGVVNARAGVVNVVGGAGGAAGGLAGAAGKGGVLGKLGTVAGAVAKVFLVGAAAAVVAELWGMKERQTAENVAAGKELLTRTETFGSTATLDEMRKSLAGIEKYAQELNWGLTPEAIAYQLNIDGVRTAIDATKSSLSQRIAELNSRTQSLQMSAALSAGALGGLQRKSWVLSPNITIPVFVTSSVSVRDQIVRTNTYARYGGGGRRL